MKFFMVFVHYSSFGIFKESSKIKLTNFTSTHDLADHSGIGVATIRRLELEDGIPSSHTRTNTLIRKSLEAAGVEFIGSPDDGPGVILRGR